MRVSVIVLFVSAFSSAVYGQDTERVSLDAFGLQANASTWSVAVDGDGHLFAFASLANNLVPGDLNATTDVFVRDTSSGVIDRVSVNSDRAEANNTSHEPCISRSGRFVVFTSRATNLGASGTGGLAEVYVRDLELGLTSLISANSSGEPANADSERAAVSDDGRFVVFESTATNLVPGDTNGERDVFLRDTVALTTIRVSTASDGSQANGHGAALSPDGRFVAFVSAATGLVSGDTNDMSDAFIKDIQTSAVERISVTSTGGQANGPTSEVSISADGTQVAFVSTAWNLVSNDSNQAQDIFVRDRSAGMTSRISVNSTGAHGNGDSQGASISADGRFVAFTSIATNLVGNDTNGMEDVFVHDRLSGTTVRESVDSSGDQANSASQWPCLSRDGLVVAFVSSASNLVLDDTNLSGDAFSRDRRGRLGDAFCFGDGSLATPCPCASPNFVPTPSGAPGHGCANSFDLSGALLSATGTMSPDTVLLTADIAPNYVSFAFMLKGTAQDAAGVANGDGVRCTDGALVRFGGHNAGSNGAPAGTWTYPNIAQTASVSNITGQIAGQNSTYQLCYRNAAAYFCSPGTTNWSNGISLHWPP